MTSENDSQAPGPIICPLARWYYRRMGILALMFTAFSALFLYDWKWGYPKENSIADQKVWFEESVMKEYDAAKAVGDESLRKWSEEAVKKGWMTDANSAPRWDAYAATRNLPTKPERKSQDAIDQQLHFGVGLLVGVLGCGVMLLINRNKTLTGSADHMVMPDGSTVRYADVFKIDKRKWDNKALAYAYYKSGADGKVRKAVIDDLKFDGAGKVFDLLMASFSGELIEKQPDHEEGTDEASANTSEEAR